MKHILLTMTLAAAAVSAGAQELQPGQYATTAVVQMPDGKPEVSQDSDCITAEDIAGGLTKLGIEKEAGSSCKVENLKQGGGKLSYTTVCVEKGKKDYVDVAGTYTSNTFDFTVRARDPKAIIKAVNVKGKRTGACSK